jgi:hypothetical protein
MSDKDTKRSGVFSRTLLAGKSCRAQLSHAPTARAEREGLCWMAGEGLMRIDFYCRAGSKGVKSTA